MTESEAKEFLANNGPWFVFLNKEGYKETQIVFENLKGIVITMEEWIDQDWLMSEFNKGLKL